MNDYPPDTIELTKALARLRAQLGIPRKRLADQIGVHSQTVRRWEAGENEPTPSVVRRLDIAVQALREAVAKKVAAELFKKGTKK
jgi:transcriptional regulator with XRE-family HTH domain